ncbi:MAG: right-handed parallel beta-helix repeat-containing protein [Anaerolineae bacterium]|nr:right-handed parallel beta-helix repeat-containing protein [Anaerolineae bacterium]
MHRLSQMRSSIVFLCLVGLLTVVVSTQAQTGITYYVAPNGNDANAGTEVKPFLTITKGLSILKPGDTLLVKAGVYREEFYNKIPSGASWQQPVTLRAYPGQQVILQPNPGAQRVITLSGDRHHIIIDGFIIDGTNVKYDAIKLAGVMDGSKPSPSYIRIINNEIRNVGVTKVSNGVYDAFGHGVLATGESNYVEYINNRIHDNGLTDYDHGIYHTSSYALIEGNIVYNNKGSGIKVGWGQNARDNIVRNNLVYDNNMAQGANGQKKQGRGIGVYSGSGTQVYNNVIWGAHVAGIDITYGGNNAMIFNNTIMSTTGYGISVGGGSDPSETASNTLVQNNVVYQQSTYPAIYNSRGINTVFQYNLTFGSNARIEAKNPASTTFLNNLENVDPLFTDVSLRNFSLKASSPAIDKGVVISSITYDFVRNARPQGASYDIGAFEFLGQALPTQPPTATLPAATPLPPTATLIPPTATPATYTNPTVFLSTTLTTAQIGGTVSFAVNVANAQNLYGLEARCTTNPAILVGENSTDGTIFTAANSLFMTRPYNSTDGSWSVAASLTRPQPAFSGNGVAFNLNYKVVGEGNTPIACAVIAVDQTGATLPFDVVNTSFSVQPPAPTGQPTAQPTGQPPLAPTQLPELPGPEKPLPTNEPPPTATVIPPTATLLPPTATPVVNTGSIKGSAVYQSFADHTGIQVQLLANNTVLGELSTDPTGIFTFTNLPPGSYVVKVLAPQHLSAAQPATVDATGQVVSLEPLTLLAGDTDDNGVIDLIDAGMIGANYGLDGALVPLADLNHDNTINIGDLVIIGINFGLTGVPNA